jgi:hypothetical protein
VIGVPAIVAQKLRIIAAIVDGDVAVIVEISGSQAASCDAAHEIRTQRALIRIHRGVRSRILAPVGKVLNWSLSLRSPQSVRSASESARWSNCSLATMGMGSRSQGDDAGSDGCLDTDSAAS